MDQERFADCEMCGQRFAGEQAIASYTRAVPTPDGGTHTYCVPCLVKFNARREAWRRSLLRYKGVGGNYV